MTIVEAAIRLSERRRTAAFIRRTAALVTDPLVQKAFTLLATKLETLENLDA